ncbi:MAG: hypothetical protein IPM29_20420 [Planctomycetes bacterium]|nr:hypothetical protein [Planctomycetota bacterium]
MVPDASRLHPGPLTHDPVAGQVPIEMPSPIAVGEAIASGLPPPTGVPAFDPGWWREPTEAVLQLAPEALPTRRWLIIVIREEPEVG